MDKKDTILTSQKAEFGPPDKATNFDKQCGSKKMAVEVNNAVVQYVPDAHPEIIGKRMHLNFTTKEGDIVRHMMV